MKFEFTLYELKLENREKIIVVSSHNYCKIQQTFRFYVGSAHQNILHLDTISIFPPSTIS